MSTETSGAAPAADGKVHYVSWASHHDVVTACDGAARWVWAGDGAALLRAEDGTLLSGRLEDVTCLACHRAFARESRERAEREAPSPEEIARRIAALAAERDELRALRAFAARVRASVGSAGDLGDVAASVEAAMAGREAP